jgi:hypothetical protein
MYDENAPKLAGLGYFPIPVAPANVTYVAKKSPVVFNVWENRYVNLAEWSTMAARLHRHSQEQISGCAVATAS